MKKAIVYLVVSLVIILTLSACTQPTNENSSASSATLTSSKAPSASTSVSAENTGPKIISAADAKMIIGTENVKLVDVRTKEEYMEAHIPGALLLPVDEIKETAVVLLPDKKTKIILYCRTGRRSAIAAIELAKMGYTNVYDMGGIQSWPYETVSGLE